MTRAIRAAELEVLDIGAEVSFVQAGWEVRAVLGAVRHGPGAVSLAPEGWGWSERALRPDHEVTVLRESTVRALTSPTTQVSEVTETETGFEATVSVFPCDPRLMNFTFIDEKDRP